LKNACFGCANRPVLKAELSIGVKYFLNNKNTPASWPIRKAFQNAASAPSTSPRPLLAQGGICHSQIREEVSFTKGRIIGRGTRINEDYDKYWFTIMDFKKATELFTDKDFDGEPVMIYVPEGRGVARAAGRSSSINRGQ
jgi:hypothetical protein